MKVSFAEEAACFIFTGQIGCTRKLEDPHYLQEIIYLIISYINSTSPHNTGPDIRMEPNAETAVIHMYKS